MTSISQEPSDTITLSRRSIIATALAAASSVAASYEPVPALANAPSTPRQVSNTEGFFFLCSKGSSGEDQSRIFFLKSEWLSYFEVTDVYFGRKDLVDKAAEKIKSKHKANQGEWHVLYSDDLNDGDVYQSSIKVADIPPPPAGQTYLAMSISPA